MNSNFFDLSKRKKRDILAELLAGKQSEGMISKKELNALYKVIGGTPQADSTHDKQPEKIKKKAATKKIKKTAYNLSGEISKNLDNARKEIRSMLPKDLQSKVTNSQIVNQALALILKEFEDKGKNSRLVQSIIKKK